MAFKYLNSAEEAKALQPVPLTEAEATKLANSIKNAEDLVDAYLKDNNVSLPIDDDNITELLKIAVALMTAADLYCGHGQKDSCKEYTDKAEAKLDEYLATTDLGVTAPKSEIETVNYQKEFIDDWAEPNETIENMDE